MLESASLAAILKGLSTVLGGADRLGFLDLPEFDFGVVDKIRDTFFGESKKDRRERRAARQMAAFNETANLKNRITQNILRQSQGGGEFLDYISNPNYYHLGSTRFNNPDAMLITRGGPGIYDIANRSARQLVDVFGSKIYSNPTGVVFMSEPTYVQGAGSMYRASLDFDPNKAEDFRRLGLKKRGSPHGDFFSKVPFDEIKRLNTEFHEQVGRERDIAREASRVASVRGGSRTGAGSGRQVPPGQQGSRYRFRLPIPRFRRNPRMPDFEQLGDLGGEGGVAMMTKSDTSVHRGMKGSPIQRQYLSPNIKDEIREFRKRVNV